MFSVFAMLGCHAMVTYSAAEHRAQEFLRNVGDDPDKQGLDELRATNPDAYAIVNALLTKRSLGMLNMRHPSASFKPTNDAPQQEGPSAVDVLRSSEPQNAASVSAEAP